MKPVVLVRWLSFLGLLVLASLACQLVGASPPIGDVVTTKSLDADQKPVSPTSTFSPDDTVYISVVAKDLVVGSVIQVKLKLGDAYVTDYTHPFDKAGSYYIGFHFPPEPVAFAYGVYAAEVYLDGKLANTVLFSVAGGPPSIDDLVSAKSVDAYGAPVEPATSFGRMDTFYISYLAKNLVVGSKIKFVFWFNGASEELPAITINKPYSGWSALPVPPPEGGRPADAAGDYKVEVYLDDTLAKTVTFTVK